MPGGAPAGQDAYLREVQALAADAASATRLRITGYLEECRQAAG